MRACILVPPRHAATEWFRVAARLIFPNLGFGGVCSVKELADGRESTVMDLERRVFEAEAEAEALRMKLMALSRSGIWIPSEIRRASLPCFASSTSPIGVSKPFARAAPTAQTCKCIKASAIQPEIHRF